MRPNVIGGGSYAGEQEEPSAVDAFSTARASGTGAMGRMIGQGVTDMARAQVQKTLNDERAFTRAAVGSFLPRGASFGSPSPSYQGRDNTSAFEAIGGALKAVLGGGGNRQSDSSSNASSGPRTYWQPSGNDGWGNTQLGARGSDASMASNAIAGFSFL